MLKDHKNKPKIIAIPDMTEAILSCCDIPSSVSRLEKEFPDVDFSLLKQAAKPELWFIYHIPDEELSKEIAA